MKPKGQVAKIGYRWQVLGYSFLLSLLFTVTCTLSTVYAIVDPFSTPNNKFGIHIIQATPDESSPSASLVNSSGGDWGYITFIIESKDRNQGKWQEFFNDLRRRHLIPLVRLATKPINEHWETPYSGEEQAWADFLDNLNWPTKNRYIIVYNEPNHAKEWGNKIDAKSYAETLDKIITAVKNKNGDFFILNGGFDSSAPSKPPLYEDQLIFMKQMDMAVPGIFNRLDGWVSHSYPNPGFVGLPNGFGRSTIRGYVWEMQQLRNLGVTKNLPIFITETGWKHAEGLSYDPSLPAADTVATYYREAFQSAWNASEIVAVTPFLLSYQESPFDHFSFKKVNSPEYYSIFETITSLPKVKGKPAQDTLAKLIKGEVYSSIVAGESYNISLTFQNTGQSIWGDSSAVTLVPIKGGQELGIDTAELPKDKKIEPGQEYTFNLKLKAPLGGAFKVVLNLFEGGKQFDSGPVEFTTEVKSPVILRIKSILGWKKDFSGNYILSVKGPTGESAKNLTLDKNGLSNDLEARYLLPDYSFEFSLEKPFYMRKTLNKKVSAGVNILDFGTLQPDILSALLHPKELWQLLPLSN